MPTQSSLEAKAQTLKRLLREYIECKAGFRTGNCGELARAIRRIAKSMNRRQLIEDALMLIGTEDYEP
jgi:hypothetical protein